MNATRSHRRISIELPVTLVTRLGNRAKDLGIARRALIEQLLEDGVPEREEQSADVNPVAAIWTGVVDGLAERITDHRIPGPALWPDAREGSIVEVATGGRVFWCTTGGQIEAATVDRGELGISAARLQMPIEHIGSAVSLAEGMAAPVDDLVADLLAQFDARIAALSRAAGYANGHLPHTATVRVLGELESHWDHVKIEVDGEMVPGRRLLVRLGMVACVPGCPA